MRVTRLIESGATARQRHVATAFIALEAGLNLRIHAADILIATKSLQDGFWLSSSSGSDGASSVLFLVMRLAGSLRNKLPGCPPR